ncbi:MAG: SAM-dependent methyltransferase [Burkholderiaceae bacterium]|nr:SAM-dependent methyltransferase [Burkholderiaceae bacterium]
MPPMSSAPAPPDAERLKFIERLRASLADGSFVKLALGRPHDAEPTLDKLLARRVLLRGQPQLSLVWRHRSKDITKNLGLDAAVEQIGQLLASQFHHGHLVTQGHDIQLAWGKRGGWGLRIGKLPQAPAPDATNPQAHDRLRQRPLTLAEPFLAELGITDGQQRLVPAMARKWRQINKFVEVFAHAFEQSPLAMRDAARPVRVLDFGAGRGYLTFALHHHLRQLGRATEVLGVELRQELVDQCNGIAQRLGLQGLAFAAGDVREHAAQPFDVMIALHACDTATDVAMHRGVVGGAAIIVCSPCCHKEIRPQLVAPPVLQPMLRHGIHQSEQAEMLTDALRALLLQGAGYDTQVFEFVSPEHTAKNKMVLAVRRAQPLSAAQQQALREQTAALKAFYGIRTQTLERLLAGEAALPDSGAWGQAYRHDG